MMRRCRTYSLLLVSLLFAAEAYGQQCTYYLPYNQNFNTGFATDNGWLNTNLDTTLVFRENCWTQYNYRANGQWPMVSYLPHEQNYQLALRLIARHIGEGQSRVERTDLISPVFLDAPTVVKFDYCNRMVIQDPDSEWVQIDVSAERTGILQLGYISDTANPEYSYHIIQNIVMDPANGATDSMRSFRLDLRTRNITLTSVKQFAFKIMTDMTDVYFTNIYIDNFHVGYEMDTITYRDTVCPGMSYDGYGFTVDSTETLEPGTYTFRREVMESYGMVCYRLLLTVYEPTTVYFDTVVDYGETIQFLDSLIAGTGDYVFPLTTPMGCDSTVVLNVSYRNVSLSASPQRVCPGEEVILTVSGAHLFRWHSIPADPMLEAQQGHDTVTVYPREKTVYQVLDADGNVLSATSVEMESCESLWIPNTFTPDGTSNNLFAFQTTLPVVAFEMTIYTRTGHLVWHCESIDQPWDGTRNGIPMPQGTYVYFYRMRTATNGHVRIGKGTVTLLR